MARGRVRPKAGRARRWRKGQSSSSNPETKKHRQAAKGKFGTHLSQPHTDSCPNPLTEKALASHDAAIQGEEDKLLEDREGEVGTEEDDKDSLTLASIKSVTSAATGTVYSLMETAHPAFRKLKRLWNSPLESHREVCAVLAAISEVVKTKEGKDSGTEYFGALMTALETSEDEKSAMAVSFLLSLILPKVPHEVLVTQYNPACKILANKLTTHETSNSTSLLKSLVSCLSTLLVAQGQSTWSEGYTQRVFQLLLNYTIHPKPRLRKSAQRGVVSLLREGTLSGDFHPSSSLVARHCKHVLEKEGLESTTLHVLGMLKDCLANFPTQHVKVLCESLLKLMTLGNSMVRTTGLKVLNGLFTSTAGPQGLTSDLNAQLLSALYDHQPSVVDAQLLQAWLTVLQSAYSKLSDLNADLFVAHLPRLFVSCVGCLLSDKDAVKNTAVSVMETLLKEHVPSNLDQLKMSKEGVPDEENKKRKDMPVLTTLKAMFRALEGGLKYKYCSSWDHVLRVFAVFYQVVGGLQQCHSFMTKALVTICDLRASPEFPFKAEADAVFGAAVKSMGVRVVLAATPLLLDPDQGGSHDFSRSWLLPVLRNNIQGDELSYFTEVFLPLAGKLRATGLQMTQSGNPLVAKLYDTLQLQIWSLLPGFCTGPVDVCKSFSTVARILGTALKEKVELRPLVCHALKLLIESNKDNDESKKELSRFSKNYLPILFELYIGTAGDSQNSATANRGPLISSIQAYVSITDTKLLESFLTNALSKLTKEEVALSSKQLLLDLVHSFIPHLPRGSLDQVFTVISPLLDAGNSVMQKKAYSCLECLLSCSSPTHQIFTADHLNDLRKLLLESLSTASPASKKPRLKCLLHIVDHLSPQSSDFIAAVLPEVILCAKEVNEKTRLLSFKLVIRLGYAAQRCYQKNIEGCIMEYFVKVLAGLAGSTHMISATILVLSRLVYEFHDLLGTDFVKRLLTTVCAFLRSKTREVVRSTLDFMKVTIGVLPPDELLSHLEDLVSSVTSWSDDNSSHFRTKSRDILERLVRKYGYEVVASFVPAKHKKFVAHIRKSVERQKRKKKQAKEAGDEKEDGDGVKSHKPSYEELLMDSSDDEEEQKSERKPKGREGKQRGVARGRAWIKEDNEESPVNFLDPGIAQRVVATDPAQLTASKKLRVNPFKTNQEGKLVITESEDVGGVTSEAGGACEGVEEMDTSEMSRIKRKRKLDEDEEHPAAHGNEGGGRGIYRKNAHKRDCDFDYGSEYRAKKAKGDVKKKGKPDPYAYVPLLRQKLNRRKEAKLKGQFSGILQKAKKGSAAGLRQRKRTK